ncbi:MAG: hypothetical protein ACTS2F_14780 [Thainema sp.]
MDNHKNAKGNPDANPDPITGQPGAHPVGTGVGAASVGAVGTAIGAVVGGPVGAVAGAFIGSIAGGLAGKGVAEQLDPTVEDEYWRNNYRSRSYVDSDYDYDRDYSHAYRTGYEGYSNYTGRGLNYSQAEPHLREDYEKRRNSNKSSLAWDKAKYATQDAWNRAQGSIQSYHTNDDYWRNNYQSRPYIDPRHDYDYYAPAYRMGYNSYALYGLNRGMSYEQVEPQIRSEYERNHAHHGLAWEKAKFAVRDAWDRVQDTVSGDNHQRSHHRSTY